MDAPLPTAELARYGRAQRAWELAGISTFTVLLFIHGKQFIEIPAPLLLPLAVAAWIAADLLSGIAHWAFDNFGRLDTPLVGRAFIRPFREHHADPQAMTRHDFVETNGASCLACVPLLLVPFLLQEMPFLKAFLVWLSVCILLTNQCHKWAHMDAPPGPVRFLQKVNLVLKAEKHRLHHTPPFRSHYCTASGWMNPVLDTLLKAK